jgi:hypothetical protein
LVTYTGTKTSKILILPRAQIHEQKQQSLGWHPCDMSTANGEESPFHRWRKRGTDKRTRALWFLPQGVGGKRSCIRITFNPPLVAGPQGSPQSSPSIAVHLHRVSWGILFALVEAGTPFYGHTLVFMPDLKNKNPKLSPGT